MITLNDVHIFRRTPWKRDQPVAETSTCTTHNIHWREICTPLAESEPGIPASERPQTYALNINTK